MQRIKELRQFLASVCRKEWTNRRRSRDRAGRRGRGRFSVSKMFAQICRHLAKGSLIPSEEPKRLMKRKWKLVLRSQKRELPPRIGTLIIYCING